MLDMRPFRPILSVRIPPYLESPVPTAFFAEKGRLLPPILRIEFNGKDILERPMVSGLFLLLFENGQLRVRAKEPLNRVIGEFADRFRRTVVNNVCGQYLGPSSCIAFLVDRGSGLHRLEFGTGQISDLVGVPGAVSNAYLPWSGAWRTWIWRRIGNR